MNVKFAALILLCRFLLMQLRHNRNLLQSLTMYRN